MVQHLSMASLHHKHLSAASQAHKAASKNVSSKNKFMPNLKQLREAADQLSDAEVFVPACFSSRLVVDDAVHTVEFKKQKIPRGSRQVSRWIYEGKVLIRNRDHKDRSS